MVGLLAVAGDPARELLRYEPGAGSAGEWWRFATAHLVHLGYTHAALNGVGLVLLLVLYGPALRIGDWVAGTLVSAAAVSAGLLWFSPSIGWYVGLSGVLHGLFALGAVALADTERRLAAGLLLGLAVKLAWEQAAGPVPGSALTAGGPVVVDAHLYGAIGGWLASLVGRLSGRAAKHV